jgi:hypothetical protein
MCDDDQCCLILVMRNSERENKRLCAPARLIKLPMLWLCDGSPVRLHLIVVLISVHMRATLGGVVVCIELPGMAMGRPQVGTMQPRTQAQGKPHPLVRKPLRAASVRPCERARKL